RVAVGGLRFVAGRVARSDASPLPHDRPPGALAVAVGIDGRLSGVLILADELRAGTEAMLSELRALGIERIVLATGDRQEVARFVATGLSLDLVRSELMPDQKILVVLAERKNGPVMMIGDGVNDAPALAAADVCVAMGGKGAAGSSQGGGAAGGRGVGGKRVCRFCRGCRCGAAGGPARPHFAGNQNRAAVAPDRLAECDRRHRPVGARHGSRLVRASGARRRSCDSGGDRRCRDLQRIESVAWLMYRLQSWQGVC